MATNRDLLKEAIADAKSVREVAIANAKLALEEAFTPHLKSMLSAKLDEMDKKDEEDADTKDKGEEERRTYRITVMLSGRRQRRRSCRFSRGTCSGGP